MDYSGSTQRYRKIVEGLGSKTSVAELLGIARELISRRCHGHTRIDREAFLALRWVRDHYIPVRRRRERERSALTAHPCMFR